MVNVEGFSIRIIASSGKGEEEGVIAEVVNFLMGDPEPSEFQMVERVQVLRKGRWERTEYRLKKSLNDTLIVVTSSGIVDVYKKNGHFRFDLSENKTIMEKIDNVVRKPDLVLHLDHPIQF